MTWAEARQGAHQCWGGAGRRAAHDRSYYGEMVIDGWDENGGGEGFPQQAHVD